MANQPPVRSAYHRADQEERAPEKGGDVFVALSDGGRLRLTRADFDRLNCEGLFDITSNGECHELLSALMEEDVVKLLRVLNVVE